MNLDDILDYLNSHIVEQQNYPFSSVESIILRGIFEDKTYREIAQQEGYSSGYLTNVVAPELYQRLSKLLGISINKKKCKQKLKTYVEFQGISKNNTNPVFSVTKETEEKRNISYPNSVLPPDSPYYIKRKNIEKKIRKELNKIGGLIIIKSPKNMGKTSLALRILEEKKQQGYKCIYINLSSADKSILIDLDKSLRWLCIRVSKELNIEPKLSLYWDQDLGSKSSCTDYFENHLLPLMKVPLILAIDEVDRFLENHEVIEEVFSLFRVWQEKSKRISIWKKISFVLLKSTEILAIKSVNDSNLKIGVEILLGPFELEETQTLIQLNQTHIKDREKFQKLTEFIGRHPELIGLTLYHIIYQNMTLEQLLETAATDEGIYTHHLRYYRSVLEDFPNLQSGFKTVVTSTKPVSLESNLSYPLHCLGLIQKNTNNTFTITSELYRTYFLDCL